VAITIEIGRRRRRKMVSQPEVAKRESHISALTWEDCGGVGVL
jgi:hypothetical protein